MDKNLSYSKESHLFKVATPDIIVSQRAPEFSKLVCEASEASSDNGSYIQRGHLVRVLRDQVA